MTFRSWRRELPPRDVGSWCPAHHEVVEAHSRNVHRWARGTPGCMGVWEVPLLLSISA